MGDFNAVASQSSTEHIRPQALESDFGKRQESAPFHDQYDFLGHLSQSQTQNAELRYLSHHGPVQESPTFAMGGLAVALPQLTIPGGRQRPRNYSSEGATALSPASVYHLHQMAQYSPQMPLSGGSFNMPVRPEHAQYLQGRFQAHLAQVPPIPPLYRPAPSGQYATSDPYAYGVHQPYYPPVNNGAVPQSLAFPGIPPDFTPYARRTPEAGTVPSFPRGPPRKPKQSGHALWVGNLPPATNVSDLKDHFSRDATRDIESLFLISRSNCAFVNYQSEAACVAAMERFHDSRFHGVRIVCRLRRGSVNTSTSSLSFRGATEPASPIVGGIPGTPEPSHGPVIVSGSGTSPHPTSSSSTETMDPPAAKVPEKYYIVKSLTLQDLEASVRNGVWATQSQNEEALNKAFSAADTVFLVFSANKSGEYFGYARMISPISGTLEVPREARSPQPHSPKSSLVADGPRSIPTPATETAPKGRIIDDSARGTIFWEAELSGEDDDDSSSQKGQSEPGELGDGQDWGRPFKIEWLSTTRVPFYRSRGLRNPWNANREVKIARDGTELEPGIGKRLVQMFHRPGQAPHAPQVRPF